MVDISVALVRRGDEILACYNDKRGAFALPMSKRREIKDPNAKDEAGRLEDGTDTAFRSAAGKNRLTGHSRSSTPHVRPAKHCPP